MDHMTTADELRAAVLKHLSEAGKKGGARSLVTMTAEQRRARAVRAGKASGAVSKEKKRIRAIFKALKENS